jgi:dihydrofolate reductase
MISLIAAMDRKLGIATDAGIPWHLSGDVAYFRERTATGVILMGRGTYSEFSEPLHDRTNFVLTSSKGELRSGFRSVPNLDAFLHDQASEEVWIIGGAAVFTQALNLAHQLFLTRVDDDFACTKFFPEYKSRFSIVDWSGTHTEVGVNYRFERWIRADES